MKQFKNLVDMQRKACGLQGPRPALGTKKGGTWVWTSFNELGRRVDALRGGLATVGVGALLSLLPTRGIPPLLKAALAAACATPLVGILLWFAAACAA